MLARSTTLRHPIAGSITTPLLIPSFSSKGFGASAKGRPEVGTLLKLAREQLTESMLLSAYDLHYKYVKRPRTSIVTSSVFRATSNWPSATTTASDSRRPSSR